MDHTASREGPNIAEVLKYLPYLARQAGYQRVRVAFGSKTSWGSTHVYPNKNGFSGHLVTESCLLICCQNHVEIYATEKVGVQVCKSATTEV
jgi:hypothetical protein